MHFDDDNVDLAQLAAFDRAQREQMKRTAGGTSGLFWIITILVLCWPTSSEPALISISTALLVFIGGYAASFLIGIPSYGLQIFASNVLFRSPEFVPTRGAAAVLLLVGWAIWIVQIVVTIFAAIWTFSLFFTVFSI
jgi:hypothetical protein